MRNWDIANVFLISFLAFSSQRDKDLLSRETVLHETSGVSEQSTDLNPNRRESFYGKLYHHSVQWSENCSLNSSELIHSVTSLWFHISMESCSVIILSLYFICWFPQPCCVLVKTCCPGWLCLVWTSEHAALAHNTYSVFVIGTRELTLGQ